MLPALKEQPALTALRAPLDHKVRPVMLVRKDLPEQLARRALKEQMV